MGTGKGRFIQTAFNGGEISPLLYSRGDLEKYKNSCIELRNFITYPQGPATFRSGLKYISTAKPTINPTWTALDPGKGSWTAIAWSPSLRLFVLLPRTATGTRSVLTSEDGITWEPTVNAILQTAVWEECIWVEELSLFVAVSSTSNVNGKRVVTSPDGKVWSEQTMSVTKAWRSICWSTSLRLLVAVANDASGTNCIMTSPDAVTWTTRTAPEASTWKAIIWVEELTKFVAVAETGTYQVMYSTNGLTWTGVVISGDARTWRSLAWSPSLTRLVAVADDGLTPRVIYSSNATSWTDGGTVPYYEWMKIIWSAEMGLFIAIAENGSLASRIMTSATGLTGSWTDIAPPDPTIDWNDLVYSPELDRVVATSSSSSDGAVNTVMYYGGTVAEAAKVRLLPFKFSTLQAYILELGHQYMRFYRNDDIITKASQQISGITKANPAVVTYTGADNFANGDRLIIRDVLGMTEVNNREFEVSNVNTGAKTFELYGINSTAYTTYVSGGSIHEIVELSTPYERDDLIDIKTCQSADILYQWHRDYQPRKLARTSHIDWTMTAIPFKSIPTGELDFDLKISQTVTSITRVTTTATATVTAHGFLVGMYVTIAGANEPEYNGTFLIVTTADANTFTYTMTADPGATATGTITVSSTTLKPLDTTGEVAVFLAGDEVFFDADVERIIKHGVSRGTITEIHPISINSNIKTGGAITRSGDTATATFTSHGFSNGNYITVLGCKQGRYNGTFKIKNVTTHTFDYDIEGKPDKPATTATDIICYLSPKGKLVNSISRSGTEAIVTTDSAHGFVNGDIVKIEGAVEDYFNGTFEIYDVESTTFLVTVPDSGNTDSDTAGDIHVTKRAPSNVVSVDISEDFTSTDVIAAGSWYLVGAPQAKLEFSKKKPVGSMVRISANKKAFREADIGKHIKFPRSDSGSYTNIEIKSYTSHKEVRGVIINTIHKDDAREVESGEWTLEQKLWSNTLGWPSCAAFLDDRLWVAKDDTIWGSVVGDYENFNLGAKDDSAIQFTLGSRQVNPIRWIEPKQGLIIGTTGEIWKIEGEGEPITPSNINNKKVVVSGSADSIAVDTPGALLYIHRLGKEIGEILYSIEEDGLISNEITLWAEHFFKYGIKEIVYQDKPIPMVVAIMNSGELCGCTYMRRQQVAGWYKLPTPFGIFDSAAVIPGEKHDQLWVSVLRQINGTNVRHIEKFAPIYGTELDDWLDDPIDLFVDNVTDSDYAKGYYVPYDVIDMFTNTHGESAFFLDSGITSISITAPSTYAITGLWHLNGMSVYAAVNGIVVGPYTVTAGVITIDNAATGIAAAYADPPVVVHVGLLYKGVLRVARQDVNLDDGTTKGSVRIVKEINVQIYGSGLFKFGDAEDNLKTAKFLQEDSTTHTLFSGNAIASGFPGKHRRDADICIVQDTALPLIIQSIVQILEVAT